MDIDYDSITVSATDAIAALATRPHDVAVCPAAEMQAHAAYVFFSWLQNVGRPAQRRDAEKMTSLIIGML